ncbi:LOW QUALITY PROTEIN: seminal plasma protein A3-like [Cervus elaphus]|uniref:LOW QUALITY PROTEIN: seminal plasma protein A3-like n=1 Tax=Cervus elaphus TaxID=9860 RepID=UPI001CC301CE|nr:LOW QUALITY PROTEIN: seminal plasma protein A3-like [Cervus elaphus]
MALCLGTFVVWVGASMFLQLDSVIGDQQLSEDYFILPEEMEDTASGTETKDMRCVFPFIYRGILCNPMKFFDCTFHDSIFLWCSLSANYTGRWKYCTKTDYAKCVFPFIHGNKSYQTCTKTGSVTKRYWCSLSPKFNEDSAWKYC